MEDRKTETDIETDIEMPEAVRHILETLESHGYQAYLVGGCVRDWLDHKQPHDYDITTSARPEEVMSLFKHTAPTGIAHGTVTVIEQGMPCEVTTMRRESGYADHRHPEHIEFTKDILEDLKRRDFTMNAMAWSPSSGLVDPFGGKQDLKDRIIRAVGDPEVRFEEDALRMFRAYRFAARLNAEIEKKTGQAIRSKARLSSTLAAERVAPEIEEILKTDPGRIEQMLDLLDPWIPELRIMNETPQNTPYHYANVLRHTLDAIKALPLKTPSTLWAALLHDSGKPDRRTTDAKGQDHFKEHELRSAEIAREILKRMKLPNAVQSEAVRMIRDHDTFYAPRLENLYKLRVRKGYSDELAQQLFALQEADIQAHATQERMESLNRFKAFYEQEKNRHPLERSQLKIDGKDLAERTSLQGKERKEALDEILHQVILHPQWDSREKQLDLLKQIEGKIRSGTLCKGGSKNRRKSENRK